MGFFLQVLTHSAELMFEMKEMSAIFNCFSEKAILISQ